MDFSFLLPLFVDASTNSSSDGSFMDAIKNELGSIGQKLIPNFFSFLVQLLALVVMILIVIYLGYKPVKKTLEARSNAVQAEITTAKENAIISEQNKQLSEQEIIEARKKANDIVLQAQNIAGVEKERIVHEGEQIVVKMKREAEEEILKAKEEAKVEIHNEIVNVALDASKEILQREISEEDNSRLVEDFIREID